jgi:hypothetical protein
MSNAAYDSTEDTIKHIRLVASCLATMCGRLTTRAMMHDRSKLKSPEKEMFDRTRPLLDKYPYGTPEYMQVVAEMGEGLNHHYAHNSHHPEHYENGVSGMDLLDIVEMFCDWKAAGERRNDVSFEDSIRISAKRFGMSEQLTEIFLNTAKRF